MPLTHERAFRIRHYECDAGGCLHPASYMRLAQETAFDASAAAGYDTATYEKLGTVWLIRETDLACRCPVRYNDEIRIRTWVEDFRRIRSRRAYEFLDAASGEQVARAATDWVYVDRAAHRPVKIPPAMMVAFYPEGAPDEAPPRERFPELPDPPGVFTALRRAAWSDIDGMGHVNNAAYLAYCDDCAFQAGEAAGWPWDRLLENGLRILTRRHQVAYLGQALPGDDLEIATWVSDLRPASFTRHFTVRLAGSADLLARASARCVAVDADALRPVRIPPAYYRECLALNGSQG
jgi:acyl-CoA thioester hydrolase